MKKLITTLFLVFGLSSEAYAESSLPKCQGDDYRQWTNCYGEMKFPRIKYKGEWKGGKFEGKGTLTEAWGGVYTGDFVNNLAHGFGKQVELDGSWWEGEVENDYLVKGKYVNSEGTILTGTFNKWLLEGPGTIEYADGSKYVGNFKKDLLHGQGTMEYADGGKYVGEWKEDYYHGKGRREYADGGYYDGEFDMDYYNGLGTMVYQNGDKYEGKWKKDYKHGQGTYEWSDGAKYIGQWKNDMKDGQATEINVHGDKFVGTFLNDWRVKGTLTWANSNKYVGGFKLGRLSGEGIFTYADGSKYTGNFKDGNFSGQGTLEYADGRKYVGQWEEDFEHGQGIITWPDGENYEGEFVFGDREGVGRYEYKSGTVYEGEFKKNQEHGKGILIYAEGDRYEGEFEKGWMHGQGTMKYNDGSIYVGLWEDGHRHGQGTMDYANGDKYIGLWEDDEKVEDKTTLAKFTTEEKYYALIIGNNNYQNQEKLAAAVNDATVLADLLKNKYGFETKLLLNSKYDQTANEIIKFTKNRERSDNLLIYYAGHGELEKDENRGYWLPVDAGATQDAKWLANDRIKNWVKSSKAKHIILIADSCFSGMLMRGTSGQDKAIEKLTKASVERYQLLKTRIVFTSGGVQPVMDSDGGEHSLFADQLIRTLRNNNKAMLSLALFQEVKNYVTHYSAQTPNRAELYNIGHDGGEFIFFPKN